MKKDNTSPTGELLMDILLVDNSSNLCRTMQLWLETRGHSTVTAFSASEAQKIAEATPPKVVITDIGLPDRSGYDLLEALKKMEALCHSCFIAFSGDADGNNKAQALRAGFDHFVSKPPDFDAFSEILEGCLPPQDGNRTDATMPAAER